MESKRWQRRDVLRPEWAQAVYPSSVVGTEPIILLVGCKADDHLARIAGRWVNPADGKPASPMDAEAAELAAFSARQWEVS